MVATKSANRPDYVLLTTLGFLLAFGLVILASVSAPFSFQKFNNTYYFLNHQLFYGLIPGLILAFLAFKINLSLVKKLAPLLLLLNLILLSFVFVPGLSLKIEGAARWVSFGFLSFQPSEFLKLTFIFYLAAWLANRTSLPNKKLRNSLTDKDPSQTFFVFIIIFGLIALTLILQPDISTLAVIFFVAALMYFVNHTPFFHTLLIFFSGTVGLFILAKIAPYRAQRLLVFFNQEIDPMGMGYQLKQSLIAIGSGGLTGAGLGMSIQKFGFLPQPISDSIFAVFSEETGFLGSFFLIVLFLLFLGRGVKIAKEAKDRFSQLTALGITAWITIQAFVNIGAMLGLLPLTGIPLPFVSYGGSALIATLIGVGILLNISKKHENTL